MNLLPQCMKYVRATDSVPRRILFAIAEASACKGGPVKLADIAATIYGSAEKEKQDVLRITLDKTLVRCGIVDKIHFGSRDVRYFLAAYRFQEIDRLQTERESIIREIGTPFVVPPEYWPIPREYFIMRTSLTGYEQVLAKAEDDFRSGLISPSTYTFQRSRLERERSKVKEQLKVFKPIDEALAARL